MTEPVLEALSSEADDDLPMIVGNSHSWLVINAAEAAGVPFRSVRFFGTGPQPPYDPEGKNLHPEIAQMLHRGRIFSAISRSVHDLLGFIQHPRPFDFVHPGCLYLAVREDAETIPYRAVREIIRCALSVEFNVLNKVKTLSGTRLTQILSPPPLKSDAFIQTRMPKFAIGKAVSSASLRMKLYLIYSALLEEWCQAHGVEMIKPPQIAVGEDGFLREEYAGNATHGNLAYGHAVLAQIQERL